MMFAAGCGSLAQDPQPVTVTEVVEVPPPEHWTRCPGPGEFDGETNRDLADHYLRTRSALEACRDRMDAIRQWGREIESAGD